MKNFLDGIACLIVLIISCLIITYFSISIHFQIIENGGYLLAFKYTSGVIGVTIFFIVIKWAFIRVWRMI